MIHLLPQAILQSAERFPQREAFKAGNQSISFEEMALSMNRLSNTLIELGVGRGDRVGIFLNRCLDTAIAMYGIMNAGAVYVPLDPFSPPARIRFLLADCGIEHVVTNKSQRRALHKVLEEETKLKSIIGLEAKSDIPSIPWETVAQMPSQNPDLKILGDDLAYILYTSGSTGTPKGIMHSHYSGLSYARLSANLFQLQKEDRIGNHAPIYFDISTLGYFSAPLVGACTIIASDAHTKMPASLSHLIQEEQISVWYSVPLALIQMMQRGALEERDWSALRWILYAGEPFPVKHLKSLMQQLPKVRFTNVYGPTEVNQCTHYHLPGVPEGEDPIPIGRTWDDTEMLIVDEEDREVGPGEKGELLIRSATMMKGYWKNPERTEQSLYRRQTASGIEQVFYRTGDLVELDEQGELLFYGRRDRQVKTRGYRVELDEVETALLAHTGVNEAAVFTLTEADETKSICAVVILNGTEQLTEADLLSHMKGKLPWYAVPQKLSIVDVLPRTATGKIDRNSLQQQALNLLNS